jgi:hypothetical protein
LLPASNSEELLGGLPEALIVANVDEMPFWLPVIVHDPASDPPFWILTLDEVHVTVAMGSSSFGKVGREVLAGSARVVVAEWEVQMIARRCGGENEVRGERRIVLLPPGRQRGMILRLPRRWRSKRRRPHA